MDAFELVQRYPEPAACLHGLARRGIKGASLRGAFRDRALSAADPGHWAEFLEKAADLSLGAGVTGPPKPAPQPWPPKGVPAAKVGPAAPVAAPAKPPAASRFDFSAMEAAPSFNLAGGLPPHRNPAGVGPSPSGTRLVNTLRAGRDQVTNRLNGVGDVMGGGTAAFGSALGQAARPFVGRDTAAAIDQLGASGSQQLTGGLHSLITGTDGTAGWRAKNVDVLPPEQQAAYYTGRTLAPAALGAMGGPAGALLGRPSPAAVDPLAAMIRSTSAPGAGAASRAKALGKGLIGLTGMGAATNATAPLGTAANDSYQSVRRLLNTEGYQKEQLYDRSLAADTRSRELLNEAIAREQAAGLAGQPAAAAAGPPAPQGGSLPAAVTNLAGTAGQAVSSALSGAGSLLGNSARGVARSLQQPLAAATATGVTPGQAAAPPAGGLAPVKLDQFVAPLAAVSPAAAGLVQAVANGRAHPDELKQLLSGQMKQSIAAQAAAEGSSPELVGQKKLQEADAARQDPQEFKARVLPANQDELEKLKAAGDKAPEQTLWQQFRALPVPAQLMIGLGLPLGIAGALNGLFGEGGLMSLLVGMLGLGAAYLGAAGSKTAPTAEDPQAAPVPWAGAQNAAATVLEQSPWLARQARKLVDLTGKGGELARYERARAAVGDGAAQVAASGNPLAAFADQGTYLAGVNREAQRQGWDPRVLNALSQ